MSGVSEGGAVGVLAGGAVGDISVCVGIGLLTADFVLAGKGVSVGCGVAIAELSAVSATVSAVDGAQDATRKPALSHPAGTTLFSQNDTTLH